jgi:hypothetical protein
MLLFVVVLVTIAKLVVTSELFPLTILKVVVIETELDKVGVLVTFSVATDTVPEPKELVIFPEADVDKFISEVDNPTELVITLKEVDKVVVCALVKTKAELVISVLVIVLGILVVVVLFKIVVVDKPVSEVDNPMKLVITFEEVDKVVVCALVISVLVIVLGILLVVVLFKIVVVDNLVVLDVA